MDNVNIAVYLKKISEFMQVLVVVLPSSLPELILEADSKPESKETFIILSNLVWVLENTDAVTFKETADKFIENEQDIKNFIKNEAIVENKKIKPKSQSLEFPLFISPDSEFLPHGLEQAAYDKLLNRKQKATRN